jgi:hypothetical protein
VEGLKRLRFGAPPAQIDPQNGWIAANEVGEQALVFGVVYQLKVATCPPTASYRQHRRRRSRWPRTSFAALIALLSVPGW